eukprot:SAG11_NODE_1696_length_4435_cov_3.645295_4_plen_124_part_00
MQIDSLVEMLDIMATNSLSAGSVLHPCPGGSAGLLAKVHTSFGTATSVDELLELLQADGSRWAAACIAGIEAYPRWCSDLTFELLGAASRCPSLSSASNNLSRSARTTTFGRAVPVVFVLTQL